MKENLKKQGGSLLFLLTLSVGIFDLILQLVARSYDFGLGNRGVSLGMMRNINIFVLFGVWCLLLFVFYKERLKNIMVELSVWMMLVGGGVNLIMRVGTGMVWDYLKIPMIELWFNMSDMMIVGGLILLLFSKKNDN